ncbi:hypothetical protein [Duganella sp. BJB476]|uniref:hypothetical protein n=1 Tax=Duganella sp. BJB476 TaxID=1871176 RepID=UPI0011C12FA9|nr:hypothetical protein [Duganella sp. BJB476]
MLSLIRSIFNSKNRKTQLAGESIANVEVKGNSNNIFINSHGLDDELSMVSAARKYKILLCIPSSEKKRHKWIEFSQKLATALRDKGFEIVEAGHLVPREKEEFIYLAEQRELMDKSCQALLILACDNTTLSQLTHLTSVVLGKNRTRKEIVVVQDEKLISGEKYFEEGALKAVQAMGKVIETPSGKVPSLDLIDEIVSIFTTYRHVMR